MRRQVFRRSEQRRQVRARGHGGQNKQLVTRRAVTPCPAASEAVFPRYRQTLYRGERVRVTAVTL